MDRITDLLNKILLFAGGVAALALMALATGNVCLRMFQMPYRGAYELVSFFGTVVIAFALGYTQKKKGHIVVDILSCRFSDKAKKIIDCVSYLLIIIFFAILAWEVSIWGFRIARCGEVSETLKIIYYPFIFCVALGFAVLCLNLIMDFLKTILKEGA